MTEVLFVEIAASRLEFKACDIAERTYNQGRRLQIIAASPQQASRLDDLLWTFRPDSFVPHALVGSGISESTLPVVITAQQERISGFEVLLMMGYCEVKLLRQFALVIHPVVSDDPDRLTASRQYWVQLREEDFALKHHRY